MKKLSVQLNDAQVSATFDLEDGTTNDVNALLTFATAFFKRELSKPVAVEPISTPAKVVAPPTPAPKTVEPPKPAKTLPLVNGERSNINSLGDKLAQAIETSHEVPDHWKTGIKEDLNGEKRYKCRIFCKNPECQHKANTYIYEDENFAECYHCKALHKVRPTSEEHLARDNFGNFFVADELVDMVASQDDIDWDALEGESK